MPVIAYGVGGAAETVLDGRTGVLFAEQSRRRAGGGDRALRGARRSTSSDARENARRFGRERFRAEMAAAIDRAAGVAPLATQAPPDG